MFWDPHLGLVPIQGRPSDGWEDKWIRVNGNGLVIGMRERPASNNAHYYDIITWNMDQGYQVYKSLTSNKKDIKETLFIASCRNADLVAINHKTDNSEDD